MDRCVLEYIARRWWRRVEVWMIALLLVIGGGFYGYQLAQRALAKSYLEQVATVRQAYDEATKQRDQRLDEITPRTDSVAAKASKAATHRLYAMGAARTSPRREQLVHSTARPQSLNVRRSFSTTMCVVT